jgi:hypothetical protein
MFNRRRFEQTDALERHLSEEAKRLREAAELLPPGAVGDATLRRAQRAETGSHISEWLRSPGLQPPKRALNKSMDRSIPKGCQTKTSQDSARRLKSAANKPNGPLACAKSYGCN